MLIYCNPKKPTSCLGTFNAFAYPRQIACLAKRYEGRRTTSRAYKEVIYGRKNKA